MPGPVLGPVLGPSLTWPLHLHSSLETHVGDVCSCFVLDTIGLQKLKQPAMKSQLETQSGDSVPELVSQPWGCIRRAVRPVFKAISQNLVWARLHVCVPVCTCVFACSCCSEQCFSDLTPQGLFKTQVAGHTGVSDAACVGWGLRVSSQRAPQDCRWEALLPCAVTPRHLCCHPHVCWPFS